MQHLRVGFFTEVYHPVVNGVVASVDALAGGLRARGHEVYCFAPKVPGYEGDGAPVFRMPSLPLPSRSPYRLTLPLVSRRNLNGVIKRLSIVHVHSPFVTGWMGMRYARRYGMPLVFTYHTKLEEYAHYVPFETKSTRYAAEALTRGFADLTDATVVPNAAMSERLRELGVMTRVEIVPSGIDLELFGSGRRDGALRARIGVADASRLLIFVSRLAREKNVELLLSALALAPSDLQLAIVGDGPQRGALERFAKECGVAERAHFLGTAARETLPHLYASADAFVFPSSTETQGLVQAEAMAAGTPVIAADVPSNRDVLGGAGRLVAPNPAAFAAAFAEVSAVRDEALADRLRASAQRFSLDVQADRMVELYQSLMPTLVP